MSIDDEIDKIIVKNLEKENNSFNISNNRNETAKKKRTNNDKTKK